LIVLIARYYVTPGNTDKVLSELRRMKPLVQASEPGCALYQVSRSEENPDLVLLYEHYRDQAALEAHRETPHFKEIVEGVIMPVLEKRERELFSLVIG
jgi:(4S)-4-hydroxy-5-phosphonooxypentane-2,3-dione isomerase